MASAFLPVLHHTSATPEQLTCVRVVCRSGPDALRLPHVAKALAEFLDGSAGWTLVQACRANLLHLIRRMLRIREVRRMLRTREVGPFGDAFEPCSSLLYRQWEFSQGLIASAATGNLELVQLLSQYFDELQIGLYNVNEAVLHEAIKFDRLEILQWLCLHPPAGPTQAVRKRAMLTQDCSSFLNYGYIGWACKEVEDAVSYGHLELAKWLFGIDGAWRSHWSDPAVVMMNWASTAAGNGDLPMLKWICSLSTDINLWHALHEAISNCRLDVVKWLTKQPRKMDVPAESKVSRSFGVEPSARLFCLDKPAAAGCLEMVEWLIRHNVDECYVDGGDLEASRQGHLEMVRLLRANSIEGCSDRVLAAAADGGHLDLVKWLYDHGVGIVPGFADAIHFAAINGHLDVVKWLQENTSERAITCVINSAASNGHLDVIQWLHENEEEYCVSPALDRAAASGHLEVVTWLHEHRSRYGCSVRAMDQAAGSGHLNVVKWLHQNRREGCTTKAMDLAAAHGHLSVVKWLHANRSEGCTTDAMDEAAKNNHLEVVQWLQENRTEGCTEEAMSRAAAEGHAEVFHFLISHRQEGDRKRALCFSLDAGHFEIARLLYQDGGERETIVKTLQTLRGGRHRWEFMEWSNSHGPTAFELAVVSNLFRM